MHPITEKIAGIVIEMSTFHVFNFSSSKFTDFWLSYASVHKFTDEGKVWR